MKRLISLVLAVSLFCVLAVGCSSAANKTESTKQAESSSAPNTAPTEKPKEISITYTTWDYADRPVSTESFIAAAKDIYNITVNLENFPTGQYENMLKTKIAAGNTPDLFNVHGLGRDGTIYGVKMLDNGMLADISDISSVKEYVPSVVENAKRNGNLFAIPISTNVLGALYDKNKFAELGLSIPKNIDEFEAMCNKMKDAGIAPIAAGFKDAWATQIIPFIAVGQYVQGLDKDVLVKIYNGEYKITSPEFIKAMSVQQDWDSKGYLSKNFLGTDVNVASSMVANGQAGMLINGSWQFTAIQEANKDAKIGFFAVPLNKPGEKTVVCTTASGGLVVNAKGANVERTKELLNYYLDARNQTLVMTEVKGISTNTSVKVNDAFLTDIAGVLKNENSDVQPNWLFTDYAIDNCDPIDIECQKLVAGQISPEDSLKNRQKQIDAEVAKRNSK